MYLTYLGEVIDLGEEIPATNVVIQFTVQAPTFENLSTEVEILETGIKVVDLTCSLY